MLLITLPLILVADPLLHIWLLEVPDYTTAFLQIVIVQSLFQVFDTSFYTALYAKGRIKENALLSPLVIFLCFPIVYFLFRMGASPLALSWAYLVGYAVLGVFVKPVLLNRICDYSWKELLKVYWVCLLVTLAALPVPTTLYFVLGVDSVGSSAIILVVTVFSVVLSTWIIGLTPAMRHRLTQAIRERFSFISNSRNRPLRM